MTSAATDSRAPLLRALSFGLVATAIALLGAWLLFGRGALPIQTDLLAMLPTTERHPLAEQAVQRLAHANGDRMVLVLVGDDDTQTKRAARQLGANLQRSGAFTQVLAQLPPFDLAQLAAPYLAHRFMLLSHADRAALTRPDYDPAQALARQLNQPLLGGIGTELQDDPFGWLQRWLAQQPWSGSPLLPEDDLLTAHRDGRTQVLISAELRGSSYDDGVQRPALAALAQAEQTLHKDYPQLQLLRTGAVFYAAPARADAEHDTHLVGITSTLGIAVLL
ncbi:MAG: hypothetical protein ABW154_09135 [Dyella sp.]